MAEQTRIYHSTLSVSADDLFAWHAHPGALERLTPPWMNVRVVSQDGIGDGDRATVNEQFLKVAQTCKSCHNQFRQTD